MTDCQTQQFSEYFEEQYGTSTEEWASWHRLVKNKLSSQDIKSAGTQQHPPLQGTCMHTWYVPCMFIVLQSRVVHAVDNSAEDGVAEEDGYERSGTVRQPKLAATRGLGGIRFR